MKTGVSLMLLPAMMVTVGCQQPSSSRPRHVGSSGYSSASVPARSEGGVTQRQVAPQRGNPPPGPELSPEERERLIQGTEREKPSSTSTPERDQ
jgi:hypothetical protein